MKHPGLSSGPCEPTTLGTAARQTRRPNWDWVAALDAFRSWRPGTRTGKGLSIWDVYADTLGKIKNEDTGDVANDHFHHYRRTSRCKIESIWKLEEWRVCPGSLPVLGWLGKGVHLRSDV